MRKAATRNLWLRRPHKYYSKEKANCQGKNEGKMRDVKLLLKCPVSSSDQYVNKRRSATTSSSRDLPFIWNRRSIERPQLTKTSRSNKESGIAMSQTAT